MIRRLLVHAAAAALLAACAPPERVVAPSSPAIEAPRAESPDAPIVRHESPQTMPPLASVAPRREAPHAAEPAPIAVPPHAIYVCVVDADGVRRQTPIEYAPRVHDLCRRHPEMGPCQYERNACRAGGGRVFAASGQEITMATEAEYDRKVMRVRFRAN